MERGHAERYGAQSRWWTAPLPPAPLACTGHGSGAYVIAVKTFRKAGSGPVRDGLIDKSRTLVGGQWERGVECTKTPTPPTKRPTQMKTLCSCEACFKNLSQDRLATRCLLEFDQGGQGLGKSTRVPRFPYVQLSASSQHTASTGYSMPSGVRFHLEQPDKAPIRCNMTGCDVAPNSRAGLWKAQVLTGAGNTHVNVVSSPIEVGRAPSTFVTARSNSLQNISHSHSQTHEQGELTTGENQSGWRRGRRGERVGRSEEE